MTTWYQPTKKRPRLAALARRSGLSLEAISDEVQASLESVGNVSHQIIQIGEDAALATFQAEMEMFAEDALKVGDDIVSLSCNA